MLSEISQTQILYDSTSMRFLVKYIEAENRTMVTRGWEEGRMGSYYLMGRVSVWEDGKVLEMDGGDGYTQGT